MPHFARKQFDRSPPLKAMVLLQQYCKRPLAVRYSNGRHYRLPEFALIPAFVHAVPSGEWQGSRMESAQTSPIPRLFHTLDSHATCVRLLCTAKHSVGSTLWKKGKGKITSRTSYLNGNAASFPLRLGAESSPNCSSCCLSHSSHCVLLYPATIGIPTMEFQLRSLWRKP